MYGPDDQFARITNHRIPRHLLYQPGFDPTRGAWLHGSWVVVPKKGFSSRAEAHRKLYANVRRARSVGPVPLSKMTHAQLQAWRHFSGYVYLETRNVDRTIQCVRVETAAGVVIEPDLKWLQEDFRKVIPRVFTPDGSRIIDQRPNVPPMLWSDDPEPVHIWPVLIQQSQAARVQALNMALAKNPEVRARSVFHVLILEGHIIRFEAFPKPLDALQNEYRHHLGEMRDTLQEEFELFYGKAREDSNDMARLGLTHTLPRFHPDGSREPWGPRDIPFEG